MFILVKLFDKSIIPAGETIQRFFYRSDTDVFPTMVETNLAIYGLKTP